ncbi:glycosyltransferase family 4 protein [Enterococcus casseliflavus]|uniref:glycosyltransferase family 4 protein n=1 Tax=Enterococcus casseliflavus TaxID=37734 RepID=UPI0018AC5A6B|nr:glycosyltransferase [Enterococcus casseliflavus]
MKIVWISNILNHHTSEVTDELYRLLGNQFVFISLHEPTSFEDTKGSDPITFLEKPYHIKYYQNKEMRVYCKELAETADVLIQQAAGDKFIRKRLKEKKLTIRISERIFKTNKMKTLRWAKYTIRNLPYRKNKNFIFLGASAYASCDMKKCFSFPDRTFKWGYFPSVVIPKDLEKTESSEQLEMIWVGRFLDWKHPELCIKIAEYMLERKQRFHITMIGEGPELSKIKINVQKKDMQSLFTFTGKQTAEKVQESMRASDVFIFSSDQSEGWGAVLNESMGSGCIPIANFKAGSSTFLIKNKRNGFLYDEDNIQTLYLCLEELISLNSTKRIEMKRQAKITIAEEWSPEKATKNLLQLISAYKLKKPELIPDEGPASLALPFSEIDISQIEMNRGSL